MGEGGGTPCFAPAELRRAPFFARSAKRGRDGGSCPASLLRSYAGHHFSRGARKMVEAVGVEPTSESAADRENYERIPFR